MPDITLSLAPDSPVPFTGANEETRVEECADALYNVCRRLGGLGFLLIACAWINQQFWAEWNHRIEIEGGTSHGQWIAMIFFGQFARPLTLWLGSLAEHSIEKRRSMLPTDHAHALSISDPRLLHLSLVGIPITVTIDRTQEIVEFTKSGNEIHLLWRDHEACLWIVSAEDPVLLTTTNVSMLATNVTRRRGYIEVAAGNVTSHVSDASFGNILEELDLRGTDLLSGNIESTSIHTNAVRTVRFELIA